MNEFLKHADEENFYVLQYDTKSTKYLNDIELQNLPEALRRFNTDLPLTENARVELIYSPDNEDKDNVLIATKEDTKGVTFAEAMTLFEYCKLVGVSSIDFGDDTFDWMSNITIEHDEYVNCKDFMDKLSLFLANTIKIVPTANEISDDYICCDVSHSLWNNETIRRQWMAFCEKNNREIFTPQAYEGENFAPLTDECLVLSPETDTGFYEVFLDTLESLLVGNYSEGDYRELYLAISQGKYEKKHKYFIIIQFSEEEAPLGSESPHHYLIREGYSPMDCLSKVLDEYDRDNFSAGLTEAGNIEEARDAVYDFEDSETLRNIVVLQDADSHEVYIANGIINVLE